MVQILPFVKRRARNRIGKGAWRLPLTTTSLSAFRVSLMSRQAWYKIFLTFIGGRYPVTTIFFDHPLGKPFPHFLHNTDCGI
jgi:hypothetical protein